MLYDTLKQIRDIKDTTHECNTHNAKANHLDKVTDKLLQLGIYKRRDTSHIYCQIRLD